MSWKTAKLIFYLGTLVSLALFLALTVVDLLTLRPPAPAARRA